MRFIPDDELVIGYTIGSIYGRVVGFLLVNSDGIKLGFIWVH